MVVSWTLRVVICLLYCQASFADLRLIQTVFRHGHRMPSKIDYPKDPYANYTYAPAGLGGLTNTGKMYMYKLGQYLRERYDQFLNRTYTRNDVLFRADEIERVIMSAQLVSAGLYPPTEEQRWNPELNWQPIPVVTLPQSTDCLYNGQFIPNFYALRDLAETTDEEVVQFENKHSDIYRYLSEQTGGNITQQKAFKLRQFLFAQEQIGLKLPEWTEKVLPGALDELAIFDIYIRTCTPELKQLSGGVWIREWLDHVDNYVNRKNNISVDINETQKAFMYAAHELNIGPILAVLDNFDNEIPFYGSCIMFELHEVNDNYYVQVLYKNKNEVRILKFPNCGDKMCPLDEFRKFVAPVVPTNMKTLCGMR